MKPESDESKMEGLLANLPPDPSPRLGKRLASAPWTPRGRQRRQTLAIAYLAILALLAVIGLTPQGRALAQTIFKYFTTTDQASVPLSDEDIEAYYAPIPTYALSLIEVTPLSPSPKGCTNLETIYACEIQKMETQFMLDLKEFADTPPGWTFSKIESDTNFEPGYTGTMISITYQSPSGFLLLNQGEGEFPPDQEVLSSAVENVQIGGYYGEYVDGYFGVRNGDTNLTWDAVGADQRLRWMEGERWFELIARVGPGTSGYLPKDVLISLASNMVYQPDNSYKSPAVGLDAIPTISLAMEICACEILQPTKLPEHMALDHIRYEPQWKSVTLIYGYRALRIVETPEESRLLHDLDSYQNVETVRIGDVSGQYGISPAQKTRWESATPLAFPSNNTYSILLWKKDGTVYEIYFDQSFSGGGQLTKQQMIEIAESLQ
jgi:hypothetical protein